MVVKKGNRSKFVVSVTDQDGQAITDLGNAQEVTFEIKLEKDGTALITKTTGSGVTINTPNTGDITIILLPADTSSFEELEYYVACEVEYSSEDIQEVYLYENKKEIEKITIAQDIIQ